MIRTIDHHGPGEQEGGGASGALFWLSVIERTLRRRPATPPLGGVFPHRVPATVLLTSMSQGPTRKYTPPLQSPGRNHFCSSSTQTMPGPQALHLPPPPDQVSDAIMQNQSLQKPFWAFPIGSSDHLMRDSQRRV